MSSCHVRRSREVISIIRTYQLTAGQVGHLKPAPQTRARANQILAAGALISFRLLLTMPDYRGGLKNDR